MLAGGVSVQSDRPGWELNSWVVAAAHDWVLGDRLFPAGGLLFPSSEALAAWQAGSWVGIGRTANGFGANTNRQINMSSDSAMLPKVLSSS